MENVVYARGQVVMISSSARLEADEVILHMDSKVARASGRVYLEQDASRAALANEAEFNWAESTSTLKDGYVLDPPWRLWGRDLQRLGPDRYKGTRMAVTSCDLDPPHYHFRGRRGSYRPKKRATVAKSSLVLGKSPVLFLPFYTRSLRDRRWTIRVDPGQNSRDGLFAKTMFGYPLTENTYLRFYGDHFQKTGNGYGGEYSYYRSDLKGSVYTYRISDRISDTQRWNVRAGHWQEIRPRLSLQANALFQSDSDFSNRFFRDDLERVRRTAESDAALTYQHSMYSARVSVEQDQVFDASRDRFVRQKTVLPQLGVQSSPLQLGRTGVYASLSGNFRNEYVRPTTAPFAADPILPARDLFRQSADTSFDLSRTIRLAKSMSLKPSAGVSETWEAWTVKGSTEIDRKDQFQGRVFTRTNFRHRVTRRLDYDLSHFYRVRWTPGQIKRDHASPLGDGGTEDNSLSLFVSYRPGRRFWARAGSGYDLRTIQGQTIKSVRKKITPPSIEFQAYPTRNVSLFFRQVVGLYPVRKPQTTQFSFQIGQSDKTHFHSGMSYNAGTPHLIQVRHGAAFALTPGWWVDGGVQYNAGGLRKTSYDTVQFIEKYLILKRDLHCWTARAEIRQRPGVDEVFFRIDLKSNLAARRELASKDEEQFYPGRPLETP